MVIGHPSHPFDVAGVLQGPFVYLYIVKTIN